MLVFRTRSYNFLKNHLLALFVILLLFQDYLERIDATGSLGLSIESILSYELGEVTRSKDSAVPELLPCGYLVGDSLSISVRLRGPADNSLDSLAFETLIPKSILQRYHKENRYSFCMPYFFFY